LRAAAADRDHAVLQREAHAVKGIAGNVKAQAAYELAQRVDLASKETREEAFGLAEQLAVEVGRVLTAVRARLDR
jgi:HPt (histidine-containing phosphotransfer) domain-containing protein